MGYEINLTVTAAFNPAAKSNSQDWLTAPMEKSLDTKTLESSLSVQAPSGFEIPAGLIPPELMAKIRSSRKKDIICDSYPYRKKMRRETYERNKRKLQIELLRAQHWIRQTGQKILLVFEGRDAAGKGGTIKRFTEHLNPRSARIVALEKPTEKEQGQWYFQRYIKHLPTAGEIVFFDRSWYNRAVVEPVMGFCTESQHHRFLREVPQLENMFIENGVILFKFWFSVSREEQLRRFLSRATDKLKQWKLSPVDMESLARWDEYTRAKKAMFMSTDTTVAPWTVVRSDCKKRARLNTLRFVLDRLDYPGKNEKVIEDLDAEIVGPKESIYDGDEW
ncbi:MAG: polyphosphate kinase 2 [Mariniblastus sp.]